VARNTLFHAQTLGPPVKWLETLYFMLTMQKERGKRKEYKRRWMAAAISLRKSRNEADTISSDDEVNTEQDQEYEVAQSTQSSLE
jgi:hypothetical protein